MRGVMLGRYAGVRVSKSVFGLWPVLTLFLLLPFPSVSHASQPVILNDSFQGTTLAPYIEYFEDTSGQLGIRDVVSEPHCSQFKQNFMKVPNFGITSSAYWLRFTVKNEFALEKNWFLEFNLAVLENIEVFIPRAFGTFARQVGGMNVPIAHRPIKHLNHIFKVRTSASTSSTIYVRLQSNTTIFANSYFWSPEEFEVQDQRAHVILGSTIGVLMVLLSIYILMHIIFRDLSAIYSFTFIAIFGLYQLSLEGVTFMILWPNSIWWGIRAPIFFGALSIIAGLQFTRHYLATKKNFPSTDAFFRLLMIVCGFTAIALFIDYKHANILSAFTAFLGCPAILITTVRAHFKGLLRVRFFMAAWALLIFCAFFYVMVVLGLFYPRFLSWNGIQLGFGISGVLFVIALADRIAAMQERNRSQIEKTVEERTQELDQTIDFLRNEIQERQRAEAALEMSEARFRLIAENSSDVIWTMDLDGKFTYVSPAIKGLSGREPEDLIGEPITPLLLPESTEKYNSIIQNALTLPAEARTSTRVMEFQMYRKDGSIADIEVSATIIASESGEAIGLQGSTRNIEERKEAEKQRAGLEEQLRQSQKMEAIGHLAGGVAHDFNNILTGIIGYAGLLLFDLPKSDPKRAQVEQIKMAADRASNLTQQLLAFSRKQIISPQVLVINDIIEQFRKMLGRIIGEDIEINFRLLGDLWAVKADPGQIDQILVNLSVNARDAMPRGGELRIETHNVDCDDKFCRLNPGMKEGKYVLLKVIDTGCGMDAKTKERIFEPFFTTKDKGKGTGLGLSTVYGIVKQNNGFIYLDSRINRGTTVCVYLPRVEEAAHPFIKPAFKDLPVGSETILVAEDENMVRSLACGMLNRQGYRVLAAKDGAEAISLFEQRKDDIDLLLTDIVMPKMNGKELYNKVSQLKPNLKVLYMSGYSEDIVAHHGILDVGIPFLQKPFTVQSLARRVREVLDS